MPFLTLLWSGISFALGNNLTAENDGRCLETFLKLHRQNAGEPLVQSSSTLEVLFIEVGGSIQEVNGQLGCLKVIIYKGLGKEMENHKTVHPLKSWYSVFLSQ